MAERGTRRSGLTAGSGMVLGIVFGAAFGHVALGMLFGAAVAAARRRAADKPS